MGMVNSLGDNLDDIKKRLFQGDQSRIRHQLDKISGKDVVTAPVTDKLPDIPQAHSILDSRNNRLLLSAYQQISEEVDSQMVLHGAHRLGIVLGSSTSGILEGELAIKTYLETGSLPSDFHYCKQEFGAVSQFLAEFSGITGPSYTISTACSSSARVFGSARNLLQSGICDAVIAGGADSLCTLTVSGFSSLDSVSESICNPMSRNRSGITIGEGAALFLMTRNEGNIKLLGFGESSDAYHISSPLPNGEGAEIAMREALKDAALDPEKISYINLHGTATLQNDIMEAKAIQRVFGLDIPCSSTKPLTGHTLGTAGAMEVGFCWLSLSSGSERCSLPPHCWDGEYDDSIPKLRLVQKGESMTADSFTAFLSNSFAFGGNNCSIIIGKGNR
jgi:3-oxoacyl-[acyl-carrier-protein] synthase-1